MTQATLKRAIKEAFVEAIREQRHLITAAMAEAIEDSALASAIREGRRSKLVRREQVIRALRGGRK
jgi:hypothetical protein